MRRRAITSMLMLASALGHAPAVGPDLAEKAADRERHGQWSEAAAIHLDAMNHAGTSPLRRRAATAAIASLAATDTPCRPGTDDAAAELEGEARRARKRLAAGEELWLLFYQAACRGDESALSRLDPTSGPAAWTGGPEIWLAIGDLSRVHGNADDAERAYRTFLNTDPAPDIATGVRVRLARARLAAGDLDGATEEITALTSDPRSPFSLRRDVLMVRSSLAEAHGQLKDALHFMRQSIVLYPDSPENAKTQLRRARLTARAGDWAHAREILNNLILESGWAVEGDQARLLLASLVKNEGADGPAQARELYRQAVQSSDVEVAARALDLLIDAWLSDHQPLRAFGILAHYMEGDDRAVAALASRRFHLMLSHYIDIFMSRDEPASAALLYRVAERTWQTSTLTPASLMTSSRAFSKLGLLEEAARIAGQALAVARNVPDRQAAALERGKLLLALGQRREALLVLLSPVAGQCAAIELALASRKEADLPDVARSLLADRDVRSCEPALRRQVAGLLGRTVEPETGTRDAETRTTTTGEEVDGVSGEGATHDES
ncbi:MAG: tetratricopeptide repeat protein [Acidobacteriota bacterium]